MEGVAGVAVVAVAGCCSTMINLKGLRNPDCCSLKTSVNYECCKQAQCENINKKRITTFMTDMLYLKTVNNQMNESDSEFKQFELLTITHRGHSHVNTVEPVSVCMSSMTKEIYFVVLSFYQTNLSTNQLNK